MNHKQMLLGTSVLLIACVAPTFAGPLNTEHVSADAKWLVHVDAERLRHNPIADVLREHHKENHNGDDHMAKLKSTLGLESWDDLKSVLFYSTTYKKGDGVMIIKAKVDQQAVLNDIKGKPSYASVKDGSDVLHSWTYTTKHRGNEQQHTVTLRFYPGDIAVMSRNPDQFGPAIDVLDGSAPSLAGGKGRLKGEAPAGASIFAEADGPVADDNAPHHMTMMRQAQHMTMALVHGDDDLAMKMTVTAPDSQVALNLQKFIEGLGAMMMLRHGGEDEQLRDLVSAMRVKADGNTVRVNWPMTNEQVMHMIKKHHAKKNRNHGKHKDETQ